jgi:hypothetical protein
MNNHSGPYLLEYELEQELEGGGGAGAGAALSGARLATAVQANRSWARQIGWGCVVGGVVSPIPPLRTLLGLGANPTEEALAQAIARWQQTWISRQVDGILGPRTWRLMDLLPASNYKQASWRVFFGGRQLGVLEKTAPYQRQVEGGRGGALVQMGFRVTDTSAVQRAGFVDAAGEDNFRWIQVVEFITVPSPTPNVYIRRATTTIDPTTLVGAQPDPHPYYWDWERNTVTPAGFNDHYHIRHFLDRQARNGLCYDLIFEDKAMFHLAAAQPGRRAYFNFETALVGVRPGRRNVILNTVRWGFDIVIEGGTPAVRLSGLRGGPYGGSAAMRRTLSQAIQAGQFPGHCFVGSGFARSTTCR